MPSLTIMVCGDAGAFRRVEPVLSVIGTPVHVGTNGQGLRLKPAVNISLALQMLAFSEDLLLAATGIGYAHRDIASIFEVLGKVTSAASN